MSGSSQGDEASEGRGGQRFAEGFQDHRCCDAVRKSLDHPALSVHNYGAGLLAQTVTSGQGTGRVAHFRHLRREDFGADRLASQDWPTEDVQEHHALIGVFEREVTQQPIVTLTAATGSAEKCNRRGRPSRLFREREDPPGNVTVGFAAATVTVGRLAGPCPPAPAAPDRTPSRVAIASKVRRASFTARPPTGFGSEPRWFLRGFAMRSSVPIRFRRWLFPAPLPRLVPAVRGPMIRHPRSTFISW